MFDASKNLFGYGDIHSSYSYYNTLELVGFKAKTVQKKASKLPELPTILDEAKKEILDKIGSQNAQPKKRTPVNLFTSLMQDQLPENSQDSDKAPTDA